MIKPNDIFKYWRADQIAECMDGVPEHLYSTLWNDIVPMQEPLEEFEHVGRLDADGRSSITLYWHLLSQADQVLLNSIADSQTDY
jgi:hypothetical protein